MNPGKKIDGLQSGYLSSSIHLPRWRGRIRGREGEQSIYSFDWKQSYSPFIRTHMFVNWSEMLESTRTF